MKKEKSVGEIYWKIQQYTERYFCNRCSPDSECGCDRYRCFHEIYQYIYF